MPLISTKDQELLDPLSDEVAEKVRSVRVGIDRFALREFAFNRARHKLLERNPSWKETDETKRQISDKDMEKLIDFEIRLDYKWELRELVRDFLEIYIPSQCANEKASRAKRIEELQKIHAGLFTNELKEEREDQEIDKPIAVGGLTRLHKAAEDGNFDEVRRLVEKEKAKVKIKDNAGMTPKDLAAIMEHHDIADYLANFG